MRANRSRLHDAGHGALKESFYTVQNDHYECKNAIRWLGFDESYEGYFSGEWATGDYPDNGVLLFRLASRPECMKNPQCAWYGEVRLLYAAGKGQ